MEERKSHPPRPDQIHPGDLMAFIYWAKVKAVQDNGDVLEVEDVDAGIKNFFVRGRNLVEKGFSASQFQETVKVTMTQAAEILVASHNRPLTVTFTKQDGTERKLSGRLIRPEPLLGRSLVEDLELEGQKRVRLVDHRSILAIIVDGVRYEVGK